MTLNLGALQPNREPLVCFDVMMAGVKAVLDLHVETWPDAPDARCRHCRQPWPCLTLTLMGAAMEAAAPAHATAPPTSTTGATA